MIKHTSIPEGRAPDALTLKTISEAEADKATRAVFNSIRSTMGVALVNLVWRRLAVNPSVLSGCWKTLKPHYQSGAIPTAAWSLRDRLELPAARSVSNKEIDSLKYELNAATIIDDVLRTYERGNAQNLIALCYLQSCLDASDTTDEKPGQRSCQIYSDQLDINQFAKEQEKDARFGNIPDLPQLDQLPEDIRLLVAKSSSIWVPSKYTTLTPSVFRHLTHWPNLLKLFASRLAEIEQVSTPDIDSLASVALTMADGHSSRLGVSSAWVRELNDSDRQWLQDVLDVFIDGMLVRGVVIVPIMRMLLGSMIAAAHCRD